MNITQMLLDLAKTKNLDPSKEDTWYHICYPDVLKMKVHLSISYSRLTSLLLMNSAGREVGVGSLRRLDDKDGDCSFPPYIIQHREISASRWCALFLTSPSPLPLFFILC